MEKPNHKKRSSKWIRNGQSAPIYNWRGYAIAEERPGYWSLKFYGSNLIDGTFRTLKLAKAYAELLESRKEEGLGD